MTALCLLLILMLLHCEQMSAIVAIQLTKLGLHTANKAPVVMLGWIVDAAVEVDEAQWR